MEVKPEDEQRTSGQNQHSTMNVRGGERVREMVICLCIFPLFIEELKYEQGLSGKDE